MKKIFTFALLALAWPIATSAQVNKAQAKQASTEFATKAVKANAAAPLFKANKAVKVVTPKAEVPEGSVEITFHVENVWGDGSGYQLLLDPTGTVQSTWAAVYEGATYTVPEGADYDPETDNKIVEGSQSIIVPAGIYAYYVTNPTPGDKVYMVSADRGGNGTYNFAEGAAYEVHVYGNSSTGDAVEILNDHAATVPTELAVVPAANTAEVTWVPGENNEGWNLRYRPYVNPANVNRFFDFNEDLEAQLNGWLVIDYDGDGYNWGTYNVDQDGGVDYVLTSASYNNTGALTPDNWLVTPAFTLGGSIKFEAWGQDADYAAEVFRVYVLQGETWESVDEFVAISEDITATGERTEFTYDLSAYEGVGRVAIRHYNVTDMFRLNIDNVAITVPNPEADAIPEWTVVEDVTNPYVIEGLTPETKYEVQVMGYNASSETEWTESAQFTTEKATAVNDVRVSDVNDNVWYNLQGMKLNSVPVQAGIYINGGKKVIIK